MIIFMQMLAILIVLYLFEITKAITSALQGDSMPKKNKMLTLNIFKYFEPIGYLLTLFFGYGWGKPAPVSFYNYKNKKAGILITHITPIVAALVYAVLFRQLMAVCGNFALPEKVSEAVILFLALASQYCVHIAVFNLIPIPPMCGCEILKCFLSPNAAFKYGQNTALFQMAFLFFWFFGMITPLLNGVTAGVLEILGI